MAGEATTDSGESALVFRWKPFLRQVFLCSQLWTIYFMAGLSFGSTTVTIPQLRAEAGSDTSITDEMVSWLSSMWSIGGVLWAAILTSTLHYFGCKKIVIFVIVNNFVAFVLLKFSKNYIHVLVSQALQGPGVASNTTLLLMYLVESTSPRYRGLFLTIKSAMFFWGIWVANAIGTFFNYRCIGLLGIICCIYSLISMFIVPDSPYWLASKQRYDECADAYRWLMGSDETSEKELKLLLNNKKDVGSSKNQKKSVRNYIRTIISELSLPEVYKPLTICMLISLLYHFCGKLVCTVYSIQILKKMTGNESAAYTGMLILDGITIMFMYAGCGLSKLLKRRTLLLSTASFGVVFLYIMSVYLFFIRHSLINENNYISIALLAAISIGLSCGPMILVTSILGELMPMKSREFWFCYMSFFNFLILSVCIKMSPYLFKNFGVDGAFITFAISTTVVLILLYRYLPETKDKTLHEITNMFKKEAPVEPTESILLTESQKYRFCWLVEKRLDMD